ncbi:NLR family CARD domain-containing protein 4-like isoform X2 [Acanthaster planci]|uniref:NLR family CARD domain-containing protein 4-like isoform X2 n=1 Tax=Acanthaster planci TaxID=133434 RepID=A0A8B7YVI3_ACAPL|nr:NLR family CARD domain-containing protein 4-like isoform X2 [Acanthaster planci]
MPKKTIQQLDKDNKATAIVYDYSSAKLGTRKSKVRRCRREAFLSLLPCRRSTSSRFHTDNKALSPLTARKSKSAPVQECGSSNAKQKLQVSVQTRPPCGPNILYFELDPETSVSSLKEKIHRSIGVLPMHQHLYIRRNVELCDLLTLHENGVDKNEIISLSTEDENQDGPKVNCQLGGKAEKVQPGKPNETRSEREQHGATPHEEQERGKRQALDKEKPQTFCYRRVKQELQVFVQNPLIRGPKTLCFRLDPEISIASLKEMIHRRIGVQPQHQCLYTWKNIRKFQLHDLLTLNDCGVQQDENISLRLLTDGLPGGGQRDPNNGAKQGVNKKQQDNTASAPATSKCTCTNVPNLSGHPSVGMSENQPRTSNQPTTHFAVSQLPPLGCTASDVQSPSAVTKCKDALKSRYRSSGCHVQLNPWLDEDKRHINHMYTRVRLVNAKLIRGNILKSYDDMLLLRTKEGDLVSLNVLSGPTGSGKTTLLDKIAYDWATDGSEVLKRYELIFKLNMRYLEQGSDLVDAVFDQLIGKDRDIGKDDLWSYIRRNCDKVLVLLDGFDEFVTENMKKPSFGSILKILNRSLCRGCSVIVGTRHTHFHLLVTRELLQEPFTHVKVMGFQEEDMVSEYVHRFYSDEPDKAKGLLKRIEICDDLSTLAESPKLLLLMCLLWREDSTLPETMSRFYRSVFTYTGKRKGLLEEDISRVVIALGKVGLRGLLSQGQEQSFKESDFERSDYELALKAGILTRKRIPKRLIPHIFVYFLYRTFQDFCAGTYLRSLFESGSEEFRNTLNEIISQGPWDFKCLLRFCCGDNEACTLEILKVFQDSYMYQDDLSLDSLVGHLALDCYFEGQCKCLPPEEFIRSFLTDHISIRSLNIDSEHSVRYFVQRIVKQTEIDTKAYLAQVKRVDIKMSDVWDVEPLVSELPNLVTLDLFQNDLRCTAALLCKQVGQCKALQHLHLSYCSLNGQDVICVAEALSDLPSVVTLNLSWNDLGGTAEWWCKQVGQCKALQNLHLSHCSLNGQDMVHVAESLSGLPNLVTLNLASNPLAGSGAWWCKQVEQCKVLQHLNLSFCSLNGQDMTLVAKSLSGLPNLVTLNLSFNDLSGAAASFWAEVKVFKALHTLELMECEETQEDERYSSELRGNPGTRFTLMYR